VDIRSLVISQIKELKILSDVRIIHRRDLNPRYSKENLHVQFIVSGDLKGIINCYLCLDGYELTTSEKNYIFPLFVETMNILIGKQISEDHNFSSLNVLLSPPKLSMIARELNTSLKLGMHSYELEVEGQSYSVLAEYLIEAMN
jgi:hypothetical protein